MSEVGRGRAWESWLCRALVAAFLLAIGAWGWKAGMTVRERAWTCTRTIRFHDDITNAMRWGNRVLRVAEAMADGKVPPDPIEADGLAPSRDAGHRLGFFEVVRGQGRVYADLVDDQPSGDFDLDYPPLRLLTMSLWTRSVQERAPGLTRWPGRRDRSANAAPRAGAVSQGAAIATEDLAEPLLRLNAAAGATTAVLAFALVWLWVDRGGRTGPLRKGKRRPGHGPRTPLGRANGMVLFPIAAAGFTYAVYVSELAVSAPPPAVSFAGPPSVYALGDRRVARVSGSVDPQGAETRWHAEWGLVAGRYDHVTPDQSVGDGSGAANVSAELTDLPAGQTIHFRLVARNDGGGVDRASVGRGATGSDDATLIATPGLVQPSPPAGVTGAVWFNRWQWVGLAGLFALAMGAVRVMPPEHRGWAAGLMAAALVWFDPALLMDAHVWPQWDVYVLPPFLLAALLASLDWWLAAGLVMGVGCMFKGQFLIGSPVLLLWPILSMRWGAAARLVIGFALSAGVLMSPWLVLGDRPPSAAPEPLHWIAAVAIAATIGAALSLYRRPAWRTARRLWSEIPKPPAPAWSPAMVRRALPARSDPAIAPVANAPVTDAPVADAPVTNAPVVDAPAVVPSVSLVAVGIFAGVVLAAIVTDTLLVARRWPADAELPRSWAGGLLALLLLPPWLLRRRSLVPWAAAVMVAAVWGSAWLFHGDWSWKTVGFEYGMHKHAHLEISHGSGSNLGTILQQQFGWDTYDPMLTFRPPNLAGPLCAGRAAPPPRWLHTLSLDGSVVTLDVRGTLLVLYGLVVLTAGVGTVIQDRRNDPRLLAALVAPWILMPSLLAQMMDRYEVWGAVLSSLLVGISSGLGIVHAVVTLTAAGMIAGQLLGPDPTRSPLVQKLVNGLGPSDAILLMAAGAVVLFIAVVPGKRQPADHPASLALPQL